MTFCIREVDSSCGFCNSPEGALYVGEESAGIRPFVLYNSRGAHACFVMYCANGNSKEKDNGSMQIDNSDGIV